MSKTRTKGAANRCPAYVLLLPLTREYFAAFTHFLHANRSSFRSKTLLAGELVSSVLFGLGSRRQQQFQCVAGLQGLLVLAQRRVVGRRRHVEAGRQPRVQETRASELIETRQIGELLQAELRQEGVRGAERQRRARRLAAATRPDPACLQQHVERTLGG